MRIRWTLVPIVDTNRRAGQPGWETTPSVVVLGRLYIAHVAILPVVLILLVALHFLLVKRHGISPLPREADAAVDGGPALERGGSTFAHHLGRMGLIGLALLVLSLVLTLIWVPALGSVPNPKVETTKPPWVFLPLYPFEDWFTVKALLWVPVIIFLGLIAVPFVDRGRYMSPRRRAVIGGDRGSRGPHAARPWHQSPGLTC